MGRLRWRSRIISLTLRVPPGDTTIGDEPFVMLDIFHPVGEDFSEKVRKQT